MVGCLVPDVADESCVVELFRLYPKIFAGLIAVSLRVDDDRIDQLEDVLLAADVAERVVVHGFPEIDVTEKGKKFDTETLNILTLCLGVMYGVAGADNALKAVAKALGSGIQKQLMKKALTQGTIYPVVKSVAKWFGVKMTKEVFTSFFKHAIPVVGGGIGGGLTYVSFKPCCDKLKASLQDTLLSNSAHEETEEEDAFDFEDAEIIEE